MKLPLNLFKLLTCFALGLFIFSTPNPANAADSWFTGEAGGTARQSHSSVLSNGKVYFWGGYDADSNLLNTIDIYDIPTNTWSTGTAGGTARQSHSSVLSNGKIYSWGGMLLTLTYSTLSISMT